MCSEPAQIRHPCSHTLVCELVCVLVNRELDLQIHTPNPLIDDPPPPPSQTQYSTALANSLVPLKGPGDEAKHSMHRYTLIHTQTQGYPLIIAVLVER